MLIPWRTDFGMNLQRISRLLEFLSVGEREVLCAIDQECGLSGR